MLIIDHIKRNFNRRKKIHVLIILTVTLFMDYIFVFRSYHTGKLFSFIPIVVFNVFVICYLLVRLCCDFYRWRISEIFSLICVFVIAIVTTIFLFYTFSNSISANITFDEETIKISCNGPIRGYPLRPTRTINIFSDENDRNLFKKTVDDEEKLISKNGIYYKKGSFAPFSGVYLILDRDRKKVLEGTAYKLGRIAFNKKFTDNKVNTIWYDNNKSDQEIVYRKKFIDEYDKNTRITSKISYNNYHEIETIMKYKERENEYFYFARYNNGVIVREEIRDEKINLYYNNGQLAFMGKLSGKYIDDEVECYYENGQIKFRGLMPGIKPPYIYNLDEFNYGDSYEFSIHILTDISTNYGEDTDNISFNTNFEKEIADHSWYYDRKGYSAVKDVNRTGYWEFYYENGQLKAVGNYLKGRHTGLWEFYHSNGQLKAKGKYSEYGVEEENWEYYYDNGQLRSKGFYAKPQSPEGNWSINYLLGGNTEIKEPLKSGEWKYYSKDGMMMAEGKYNAGEKTGIWLIRLEENEELEEISF